LNLQHMLRVCSGTCKYELIVVDVSISPSPYNTIQQKITNTHLEIDVSILIHIKRSEYVIAKFFSITRWKEHFVHIDEFGWC
jgi:hypothetical protein